MHDNKVYNIHVFVVCMCINTWLSIEYKNDITATFWFLGNTFFVKKKPKHSDFANLILSTQYLSKIDFNID